LTVYYADFVRANTATTGTGTISLGSAVSGFRTFAQAVTDGQLVSGGSVQYGIQDGTNFESGHGVYTAGSPDTLTRVVSTSSSGGTTAITLSGSAQVYITVTGASLSATANAATSTPFRNRLHNAWHEIQQRFNAGNIGTYYTATDRWAVDSNTHGNLNWSVIDNSTGAVFASPQRFVLQTVSSSTVSSGGYNIHRQTIESADSFDLVGATVTVSGYVNCSTSAGAITTTIGLYYPSTVNGAGFFGTLIGSLVTIAATGGLYTATFTGLPSGVTNALCLRIISTQSGSSGTITMQTTGFQLEVGPVATPCEKRPYQTELLLCQRFYYAGTLYNHISNVVASQWISAYDSFATPMRTPPSYVALGTGATANVGTITGSNISSFYGPFLATYIGAYIAVVTVSGSTDTILDVMYAAMAELY
jgi:hypothetical protein